MNKPASFEKFIESKKEHDKIVIYKVPREHNVILKKIAKKHGVTVQKVLLAMIRVAVEADQGK